MKKQCHFTCCTSLCAFLITGCAQGDGLSASLTSPPDEVVEQYETLWTANTALRAVPPYSGNGFAEVSYATDGTNGMFFHRIRAQLPVSGPSARYHAWLLRDRTMLGKEFLDTGYLENIDGGSTYTLDYTRVLTPEEHAALQNLSEYLTVVVTQEDGTEENTVLEGTLNIVQSVGLTE